MPDLDVLLPPVTELLQLVASLGTELDGLEETAHPFVHRVVMLHLTDRIAKVNRTVRATLLSSLPPATTNQPGGAR